MTHLYNEDKNEGVKGPWSPLRARENVKYVRDTLLYYFVKPRAAPIGPLFPLGQPVLSTKEHSFFLDCLLFLTTGLSPSLSVFSCILGLRGLHRLPAFSTSYCVSQ